MSDFRRLVEKRFERHFINSKCLMSNFLITRPYHPCYVDSPRILINANDSGLIIALPGRIFSPECTLLIFDEFHDRICWSSTLFPITCAEISEGVYSFGRLYVNGTKINRYFICSFDFETSVWSILRYAENNLCLKLFVQSPVNDLQCLLHTYTHQLKIFKIDQKNNVSISHRRTINSHAAFVELECRRNLFDGHQRIWRIGFQHGLIKSIFALNLLNYTWEVYEMCPNLSLVPSPSIESWSCLLRRDVFYFFEPAASGTKIWHLNLKNILDGWFRSTNKLSNIVIANEFNRLFDHLFLLCVYPREEDDVENENYERYCNLSTRRVFIGVPRLDYFSLATVCCRIQQSKVNNRSDLNVLNLPEIYLETIWNRVSIVNKISRRFKFLMI